MTTKSQKITSLILKLIVVLGAGYGVISSTIFFANNLLYFTLQSNIWIAVVCLVGIILILMEMKTKKCYTKKWMIILKFVFTVSITITGLFFCFVLAPTVDLQWVLNPENIVLHVVVPIAAIADFFVYDCTMKFKKRYVWWAIIPFAYYLILCIVGYVCNWDFGNGLNYPYFFMNWGSQAGIFGFSSELPYMAPPYWGNLLILLVIGLGLLYIYCANKKFTKKQTVKTLESKKGS